MSSTRRYLPDSDRNRACSSITPVSVAALLPMLGDQRHLELAYSVMFSLPGMPVIRYGDEFGMGDDLSLKERAAVRTPMHWNSEAQAGFSTSTKTVHPVISKGPYRYDQVNVEAQRRGRGSLLN